MTTATETTTATVYRPTLDCDLLGCTAPIAVHVLADGLAIAVYDSEADALYDSLDDLVREHACDPARMSEADLKAAILAAEHGEIEYTAEELVEAVERHAASYGGHSLPNRWVAFIEAADLTKRCRELLGRLRVGSLPVSTLPIDVVNTLAERGLVELRPDAPSQLWLTGRGRGVDPSAFDA